MARRGHSLGPTIVRVQIRTCEFVGVLKYGFVGWFEFLALPQKITQFRPTLILKSFGNRLLGFARVQVFNESLDKLSKSESRLFSKCIVDGIFVSFYLGQDSLDGWTMRHDVWT